MGSNAYICVIMEVNCSNVACLLMVICIYVCFCRLVFSQSLLSLDLIEDFLQMKTDEVTRQTGTAEVSLCLSVFVSLSLSLCVVSQFVCLCLVCLLIG